MVGTKFLQSQLDFIIGNTISDRATKISGYLGGINSIPNTRNKNRNRKIRSSFVSLKKVYTQQNISIELRLRMLRCPVFPVLLYGVEPGTRTRHHLDKLQVFKMWCYRRRWRIRWTKSSLIKNPAGNWVNGPIQRRSIYTLLPLLMQGK